MVQQYTSKAFYNLPVLTVNDLPLSGIPNEIRFVISEDCLYGYNDNKWVNIGVSGTGDFRADGSVPASNNWNLAGFGLLNLGQITSPSNTGFAFLSRIVNTAGNIAFKLNTLNDITNPSALLISLQVKDVEKASVNALGDMKIVGSLTLKGIIMGRIAADGDIWSDGEGIIGVTNTTYPVTVTLSTVDLVEGRIIRVKDESGGAGANTITVIPEDPYVTIDGNPSEDITIGYDYRTFYSDGVNWFII